MNTFRIPITFVTLFIIFAGIFIYIGGVFDIIESIIFGAVLGGIAVGIAITNAYPRLFLDKNSTDYEWSKQK